MMEEVRLTLRLPKALRDELQAAADANDRSLNGEIVARLRVDQIEAISERTAQKVLAVLTSSGAR